MRSKYFIVFSLILVVLALPNFIWADDPGHPRLLLTEDEAQNIWNRIISTSLSLDPVDSMWAKLRAEAEYTIDTWCGSNPDCEAPVPGRFHKL